LLAASLTKYRKVSVGGKIAKYPSLLVDIARMVNSIYTVYTVKFNPAVLHTI
jgi:hypothetical protein